MPFRDPIASAADLVQRARDFMRLYFSDSLEGAWMCAFNGDPALGANWTGLSAARVLDELDDFIVSNRGTPPNLYWSPYRYRGGVRGGDNFIEAVAIVVDDVGSQVDVDAADRRHETALQRFRDGVLAAWRAKPVATRGPKPKPPKREGVKIAAEKMLERIGPPTTALETSAGNEQWFYRLDEPCRDKAKLRAMLMAIGSDAKDLARVMRCPGGANWKAGALIDGKPFIGRLGEASSGDVYKITDMLAAVGADVHPEMERHRPSSAEEKLEVQALREAGLLLSSAATANPETHGSIWMTCPGHLGGEEEGGWPGAEIGHSAGKDEGRARVWPHGGFKCFHDSCRGRSFNDLCTWVASHPDAGPILSRLKDAEAAELAALPLPGDEGGGADEDDDDDDIIGDDAPRVIRIDPGRLEFQVIETVKALRKRRPVYYFGRKTIQVVPMVERDGIGGKVKTSQLVRLHDSNVAQRLLEGLVDWYKWNEKKGDYVRCNVTPRIAANICNSSDLKLEEIIGIIRAPFLRYDGTIGGLKEGYDRKTGLWVDYAGATYQPILDAKCTREGAQAALERIKVPLSEYKFAPSANELEAIDKVRARGHGSSKEIKEALAAAQEKAGTLGRAVALAAMLTPPARPAMSQVPLFVIDAPERGSGKTKLALAVCALMTGISPALVQGTSDSIELDKRVNAVLLTGEQLVVIDNITGKTWGTSDLCASITTDRVNIRPLGTSDSVPVRNGFILFITGNNVAVEGDISRRAVICRIDPDVERPENEPHSFDPVEYVREHRPELVRDVLIVLRSYILAGSPEQNGRVIGSFGRWARIVRDSLMWLGEPDVTLAVDVSRASNTPELDALLTAWETAFGTGSIKARKAKDLLGFEISMDPKLKAFGECLRENILSLGADKKTSEAGWLGNWLKSKLGQRAAGLKLQRRMKDGTALWYVERPEKVMGDDEADDDDDSII
jgi:RepB DNA-primase from phage plasmid